MKKTLAVLGVALLVLTGCDPEAKDVDKNLSTDADNFQIERKVMFVNGITDKVMLEIDGLCSVDMSNPERYSVTCKDNTGSYVKHLMGKSDNVTAVVQQTSATKTSTSHYRFVLRPDALIPDVDVHRP